MERLLFFVELYLYECLLSSLMPQSLILVWLNFMEGLL